MATFTILFCPPQAVQMVFYCLLCILAPTCCLGFGTSASNANIARIKSTITDAYSAGFDATTIPIADIIYHDADLSTTVSYASDFFPRQEGISITSYCQFTQARHADDCMQLFDGYKTKLIRCEILDENSLNMRWEATWIPAGSSWLYNLADITGWKVIQRRPDPAIISTFSWRAVFGMFRGAFASGNITLPISSVEGNTVVSLLEKKKVSDENMNNNVHCIISLKESIDLVSEADKGRLENRRVAQEVASWIDVSRRPPEKEFGIDANEWAGIVRQRILSGVPGAGALDVDPNEDDVEGGIALLIFGVVCFGVLALSFEYFTLPDFGGGAGTTIPDKCDSVEILEFGSGY